MAKPALIWTEPAERGPMETPDSTRTAADGRFIVNPYMGGKWLAQDWGEPPPGYQRPGILGTYDTDTEAMRACESKWQSEPAPATAMTTETPAAPPESCSSCRFWLDSGYCRRYPRRYAGDTSESDRRGREAIWAYPEHGPADWCGEWRPAGQPVVTLGDVISKLQDIDVQIWRLDEAIKYR